jgi:hypothetical protein
VLFFDVQKYTFFKINTLISDWIYYIFFSLAVKIALAPVLNSKGRSEEQPL